ncbi:hypothetical protein GCM10022293_52430 [Azospirillum formosense]
MAAGAQGGDKLGTDQSRSTDDDDFHESLSCPTGIRCPIEKPGMAKGGGGPPTLADHRDPAAHLITRTVSVRVHPRKQKTQTIFVSVSVAE